MRKKILTLFLVFAVCLTTNAQRIVSDKVEGDIRTIATDWFTMWTKPTFDMTNICESVQAKLISCSNSDKVVYLLCLSIKYPVLFVDERQIPENGKLLMRFKDESVIELTNLTSADNQYQIENIDVTTIQGNTIITEGKIFVGNTRELMGIYPISEDNVKKLSVGVSKVRIELLPKNFDFEFKKKEKFGARTIQAYDLIKTRLLENKKSSVYDGF